MARGVGGEIDLFVGVDSARMVIVRVLEAPFVDVETIAGSSAVWTQSDGLRGTRRWTRLSLSEIGQVVLAREESAL